MTPFVWRVQSPGETLIGRLDMAQSLGRQGRDVLPALGRRKHFLEELTPGLSSDEVRLVEEGEATARAGMVVREFAHSSTQRPGQKDSVPQSRPGEGQGMGQRANGKSTCPLLDRFLQALPHRPASSFIASLGFQALFGF